MKPRPLLAVLALAAFNLAVPVFAAAPARPPAPVRDPNAPGFVHATPITVSADELAKLKAALASPPAAAGDTSAKNIFQEFSELNPPVTADGNFIIGPDYLRAPEYTRQPDVPRGTVSSFTMNSTDSKFYPGIDRDPDTAGTADPDNPLTMLVPTSHPAPYTRKVTVYVPAQYVPGTPVPFMVTADGFDSSIPTVLDNLIAQHRIPPIVVIGIAHGGRSDSDAQGSERGLEYDTVSGRYAEFVQTEVLPRVEKEAHVTLTQDPDGRATMGSSSGGAAAFAMAWFHPEWYHRVLTYSGTFVNQQWPFNPALPHGAWEFHEHLIPQNPAKPIRMWLEVGDRDNYNPNPMRDNLHDWVVANEHMVAALAAKGYHYQFVFALHAGHTDRTVRAQTLPDALEWLWQGYAPKPAPPAAATANSAK
jgi:enterochelin esterase-like enzyme